MCYADHKVPENAARGRCCEQDAHADAPEDMLVEMDTGRPQPQPLQEEHDIDDEELLALAMQPTQEEVSHSAFNVSFFLGVLHMLITNVLAHVDTVH